MDKDNELALGESSKEFIQEIDSATKKKTECEQEDEEEVEESVHNQSSEEQLFELNVNNALKCKMIRKASDAEKMNFGDLVFISRGMENRTHEE